MLFLGLAGDIVADHTDAIDESITGEAEQASQGRNSVEGEGDAISDTDVADGARSRGCLDLEASDGSAKSVKLDALYWCVDRVRQLQSLTVNCAGPNWRQINVVVAAAVVMGKFQAEHRQNP